MNMCDFLQSLPNLNPDNIYCRDHFDLRLGERKDDLMPDIEGIKNLLISGRVVASSEQDENKFSIMFNLNEKYDLFLVVGVRDTYPELSINLITCYKVITKRRLKKDDI